MGVGIDEAGRNHQPGCVDHSRSAFLQLPDTDDLSRLDANVHMASGCPCPVNDQTTANRQIDCHIASPGLSGPPVR
jgi:hypothetical protein